MLYLLYKCFAFVFSFVDGLTQQISEWQFEISPLARQLTVPHQVEAGQQLVLRLNEYGLGDEGRLEKKKANKARVKLKVFSKKDSTQRNGNTAISTKQKSTNLNTLRKDKRNGLPN